MPGLFRRLLGFIVLVATIGLATCQSMVKAEPSRSRYSADACSTVNLQAD
jgi:hypothetical protein